MRPAILYVSIGATNPMAASETGRRNARRPMLRFIAATSRSSITT